jgi:hypothetical protein
MMPELNQLAFAVRKKSKGLSDPGSINTSAQIFTQSTVTPLPILRGKKVAEKVKSILTMVPEPTKPIITLAMMQELSQLVSVAKRRSRELPDPESTNTSVLTSILNTATPQLTSKGKRVVKRVR